MRVLVTGIAGRIGSKVAERLLGNHHSVVGLDVRPTNLVNPRLETIQSSFSDHEAVGRAMTSVDAVLHLGGLMSWLAKDTDRLFQANVDGTRAILEGAATADVQRFVFASTGEVYPETNPAYLPIDEDHPCQPTSTYGLTKLLGEQLVRFFGRTKGLPFVILRFGHTQNAEELLDPRSFFSGPRFFLEPKIRQQEAFGNHAAVAVLRAHADGSQKLVLSCDETSRPFQMHITDTRDLADGILLALQHADALGETFNLGATRPVNFEELLPAMAERTGLPLVRVDLPGAGVFYETSNYKSRNLLDFKPRFDIGAMLDEAAVWRARSR